VTNGYPKQFYFDPASTAISSLNPMASTEVFSFTNNTKNSFDADNFDNESSVDSALTSSSNSPSSTSSSSGDSNNGNAAIGVTNSVVESLFDDDNDDGDQQEVVAAAVSDKLDQLEGSLENESLSDVPDQDCGVCQ
jgi:hypothetical protein